MDVEPTTISAAATATAVAVAAGGLVQKWKHDRKASDRQWEAERRSEWWRRVEFAITLTRSGSQRDVDTGAALLEALGTSELRTNADNPVFDAISGIILKRLATKPDAEYSDGSERDGDAT